MLEKRSARMLRPTAAVAVAMAMSACASTADKFDPAGATILNGDEIRERLEGNTLRGTSYTADNPKYSDYVIHYPSYGTMRLASADFKDSGTWRVVDDMYCRKWTEVRQSAEQCWTFYEDEDEDGGIAWVDDSGVKTDDSVIETGNPDSL